MTENHTPHELVKLLMVHAQQVTEHKEKHPHHVDHELHHDIESLPPKNVSGHKEK